jgi:hypothetical protein
MAMTADTFRRLALELDDAVEGAHMGHPDFRVDGRIFASIHAGDATGMVQLAPDEQAALLREQPRAFSPAAGAWGRAGSTIVHFAEADGATVRGALLLAYQRTQAKAAAPRRRTTAGTGRKRTPRRVR